MQSRATLFLLLALLALAVRALVPAGFMPAAHDGRLVLDICTGQGAIKVDVGGSGHSAPAKAGESCPFAGGASLATLSNALIFKAISIVFPVALAFRPSAVTFATFTRLRPPLRGPPAV